MFHSFQTMDAAVSIEPTAVKQEEEEYLMRKVST